MMGAGEQKPGFWPAVWLLLRSGRRRYNGRKRRQQQLLNQRGGQNATDWGFIGSLLGVLFMTLVHGLAAATLYFSVMAGERIALEHSGKIVVSGQFRHTMRVMDKQLQSLHIPREMVEPNVYEAEAQLIVNEDGGSKEEIAQKLRNNYIAHGVDNFITRKAAKGTFRQFAEARWNGVPKMLGSIVLLWWGLMLAFQGEGLELDLQRRRHPMWEWLFSHPVPMGAVFLAEMLTPLAANPIYWTAPAFVGAAYGMVYGPAIGVISALLVGVPITVAAGCLGKAIEIGVTLRVAPRQRGAVIGLMSWLGYASMMLLFLGTFVAPKLSSLALKWLTPLAVLPWPWLGLFLGLKPGGQFSFALGLVTCWVAAVVVLTGSVWITVWGTQKGLAGAFGSAVRATPRKPARFGREPLYRKEMLWFLRDRSAIVQSILIPLTVAGVQAFNLRGVMKYAQGE